MLNKIRKLREKKGFTLVELIVVIAIIAILTAVLVPLIGNWTQQASYTTLQDAAQTISNSTNTAIGKVMMGGAPLNIEEIKGSKSGTTLTITVDGKSGDKLSGDNKKVADEVKATLEATMSDNSAFVATISNGAVTGVIYTNKSKDAPTAPEDANITKLIVTVDGFDNAFELKANASDEKGDAVGVSGKFKVAKAADADE